MAYTGTTFITFPNGDTIDVAQTSMTVSGNTLTIKKGGQPHYQYTFSSMPDAIRYIGIIASVVSSFNYQPIAFYEWSSDGAAWQFGSIPVDTQPIYLQVFGQNIGIATSATVVDFSGRSFQIPVISSTSSVATVGPFAAPGQNTPVIGNATLSLFNATGIAIASTIINVGPVVPFTWTPASEASLYQWLRADSISQSQGSTVTDWPASHGQDATCASPTFQTNIRNGLPVVRFAAADSDYGTMSSFNISSLPFTVAFVFRNNGSSPTDILMESSSGFFEIADNAGELYMNFGGSVVNIAVIDNNFHLLVIVCNGASTTYALDGMPLGPAATNPGSPQPNGLTIAAQSGGGGNNASVDFGEIMFWTADGTMFYDDLVEYIGNRWNL